MAIRFYLEIAGKRYILPVNPSAIKISVPSRNESNEVVKLGEITQLAKKGLKSISFDSFFPLDTHFSYVNDGSTFLKPEAYVELIEEAMDSLKPIRLIITDTKINMLVSIDEFSPSIEDSTGDYNYSITFKEYKEYSAKYIKNVAKPVQKLRPAATQKITIGCEVIVNGRLHRDSYGSGPGRTEVNARRKVNFIVPGRAYPYHVTMLDGGWRGWVTAGSVRRV